MTVCEVGAGAGPPQPLVGVQDCEVTGCAPAPAEPAHRELSTVWLVARAIQVTVRVCVPVPGVPAQLAERVCWVLPHEAAVGDQAEYSQVEVPPPQPPKPPALHSYGQLV